MSPKSSIAWIVPGQRACRGFPGVVAGYRAYMFTRRRPATEVVDRETVWSGRQVVALVVGGASIVFGALALAETGVDVDHLYESHTSVAGFHHTELMAIIEIGFGLAMLLAAITPAGRGLMAVLGIGALALGVVQLVDVWPNRLHDYLGIHDRNGWLFVAVGAVTLLAVAFLPTVHHRVVEERTEPLEPARR